MVKIDPVEKSVENRFLSTLNKIPESHWKGATFEWHYSLNPLGIYHGLGPHGRYDDKNDIVKLRNTPQLQRRTIVHEIGHRVYNKVLTPAEREKWEKASVNEAPRMRQWGIEYFLPEELFAELYADMFLPKTSLVSLGRLESSTQTVFREIVKSHEQNLSTY